MRAKSGSTGSGGAAHPKKTAKQVSKANRDYNSNARKPAPYGRYEDKSARPATKSAVKKAGAEGRKRSVPRKKK